MKYTMLPTSITRDYSLSLATDAIYIFQDKWESQVLEYKSQDLLKQYIDFLFELVALASFHTHYLQFFSVLVLVAEHLNSFDDFKYAMANISDMFVKTFKAIQKMETNEIEF